MIPPLLAIFAWPVAGFAFFKKLQVQQAIIWCIVAGYLFLPEGVGLNLPVLPTVSKVSMPSFVALAMALIALQMASYSRKGEVLWTAGGPVLPGWLPRQGLMLVLLTLYLLGEVITVLTNGDRLVYGPLVLPGLSAYDAGSRLLATAVTLIPLILGRKFLGAPQQHKTLVVAFVFAGLLYSLPTLFEVRMSPQLNERVYGLRLETWTQHIRGDGFRPFVFLRHGLWLAMFLAICCVAAAAYVRMAPPRRRVLAIFVTVWMFATLFLINSLGGLLIAIIVALPVLFLTVRLQMLIAAGLVAVVLLYPMMRGVGLVPIEQALSLAEDFDADRAQSLGFRFRHEDALLEKAQDRPLFGWGSWGRNQIFDEDGNNVSVTDGRWIIQIGSNGWIGYIALFGLFCIPIILLALRPKRYPGDIATAGVIMMMAANMADLIPNSSLTPLTWLLAGALIGRLEYDEDMLVSDADAAAELTKAAPTRTRNAYSRQTTTHNRRTKDQRND